jgi:hypothetical protein
MGLIVLVVTIDIVILARGSRRGERLIGRGGLNKRAERDCHANGSERKVRFRKHPRIRRHFSGQCKRFITLL